MRKQGVSLRRKLVAGARADGWRSAASKLLAVRHPDLFRYAADERTGDWRFLLPRLPRHSVLCAGGALSPVPFSLARTCERVVVTAHNLDSAFLRARAHQEGFSNIHPISYPLDQFVEQFDLVAGLRPAPGLPGVEWRRSRLPDVTKRVKPGGNLYLEISRPSVLAPPALLRRQLKSLGFTHITFYWPKPTFDTCEMLIPLEDRRLQRYYLQNQFFAMSLQRRALKRLLWVAVLLGLFELILPCYMVVATRQPDSEGAG